MEIEGQTVVDPHDAVAAEQEEAAFEAGFEGTDIEPGPAETPTETAPEEGAAPEIEVQIETGTETPLKLDDVLAKLQERDQEWQKKLDKVFGTVGELKQRQQKLEEARTSATGMSPKARERIEADFPELAAMLFDPISETPAAEPEPLPAPAAVVEPAVDSTLLIERRFLTRDHPDWERVVKGTDFQEWTVSQLSPEDAAELAATNNADYVSEKLTKFKAWKVSEDKRIAEEAQRQEQLESAVVPQGGRRGAVSTRGTDEEEEAMMASYGKR